MKNLLPPSPQKFKLFEPFNRNQLLSGNRQSGALAPALCRF